MEGLLRADEGDKYDMHAAAAAAALPRVCVIFVVVVADVAAADGASHYFTGVDGVKCNSGHMHVFIGTM